MAVLAVTVSTSASADGIDAIINASMQPITDALVGFIFFEVRRVRSCPFNVLHDHLKGRDLGYE